MCRERERFYFFFQSSFTRNRTLAVKYPVRIKRSTVGAQDRNQGIKAGVRNLLNNDL